VRARSAPDSRLAQDPLYSLDSRVYNDRSMFGNASPWPVYIINSLHLYHLLFFRLSDEELVHHLLFVPVIGFAGQYYEWGAALSFMAFFISGLPGLIDYFLLVLVKHKRLDALTQKRVCASLNVYVRGPFLIVSAHTIWLAMRYGHLTVPYWVGAAVLVVSLMNATVYVRRSIANWAVSNLLTTLEKATAGLEAQMPTLPITVTNWRQEAEKIC